MKNWRKGMIIVANFERCVVGQVLVPAASRGVRRRRRRRRASSCWVTGRSCLWCWPVSRARTTSGRDCSPLCRHSSTRWSKNSSRFYQAWQKIKQIIVFRPHNLYSGRKIIICVSFLFQILWKLHFYSILNLILRFTKEEGGGRGLKTSVTICPSTLYPNCLRYIRS